MRNPHTGQLRGVTRDELRELLAAQGVPKRHVAFKCPVCGTVQSAHSLILAGAGDEPKDVADVLGFSCVGRFTHRKPAGEAEPDTGCDWTLGGLFRLHTLEVVVDGKPVPCFEPASPEEAQALYRLHTEGEG